MDVHKRMKPSSQFQWEKPYASKIKALTRVVQLMKTEGISPCFQSNGRKETLLNSTRSRACFISELLAYGPTLNETPEGLGLSR